MRNSDVNFCFSPRVYGLAMNTINSAARSTQKMRRDVVGGKRGIGHQLQREHRRIRRPDPSRIAVGRPDASLTSSSGLVPFGQFLRQIGLDHDLARRFNHLKPGRAVVYPMHAQLRMLLDANVVGELRVFGLEQCAADPLFVRLAGGTVPSIDTVYRDLQRFDSAALMSLESLMAIHGLWPADLARHDVVHLDLDTTVEPLFGSQEGALPGPNPRYHGRPSYHPILASIAETRTCVGAQLRPGNTSLGNADASFVEYVVCRVKQILDANQTLRVRIDAAGDCTEILRSIHDQGAAFTVKARLTEDLCRAIHGVTTWRTVDADANGRPTRQVAEVPFQRGEWGHANCAFRVVAVRERDSTSGKQVLLWPDLDYSVKAFITNDPVADPDDLARNYEDRAGIEPLIGEFKYDLGIGRVPTDDFDANHAMLLLKLLTHNLVCRFVEQFAPQLRAWRLPWLRRAVFCVPGRLVQSGHRTTLRLPPRSHLHRLLN